MALSLASALLTNHDAGPGAGTMFALLVATMLDDVNGINTLAEPCSANGTATNTIIDSNDSPPGNNQQRMAKRGY